MQRTRLYLLPRITLCIAGGIALFCACNTTNLERINTGKLPTQQQQSAQPAASPNTHNYKEILAQLEAGRRKLASRYQRASAAERIVLIDEARTVITRSIYDDLVPAWYGTAWDFNGTSETPQQGKIACGYFVSTVLRDAGYKVERVRLAQQASENIILSLTTDSFVKRFRRVAIGDFVDAVKEWGPGIYIVGLDIHVGFIVNTGDEVYFIHSSYVEPYTVVREKAIESRILAGSNYRVLGKVFADDRLISNWLAGNAIPTKIASATRGP
jgi:hypothetical protein